MGIALSAFHGFFSPFASLLDWLAPPAPRRLPAAAHRPMAARPFARATPRPAAAPSTLACKRAKPLRVVRLAESGTGHPGAGRMVISGCIDDVCAELDRLAALEARQPH